jgi:desulfoferrodoxin (superoxide reductase-like protein)
MYATDNDVAINIHGNVIERTMIIPSPVLDHQKHPWAWVRVTKCKNSMQVGQLQLHRSHEPTTLVSAKSLKKLDFATPFCSVHV